MINLKNDYFAAEVTMWWNTADIYSRQRALLQAGGTEAEAKLYRGAAGLHQLPGALSAKTYSHLYDCLNLSFRL